MDQRPPLAVAPAQAAHRAAVADLFTRHFGATRFVIRGTLFDAFDFPVLVAEDGGELAGAVSYALDGDVVEIMVIAAAEPGRGVGRALMDAVAGEGRLRGCTRMRVVTTDDNTAAQAAYQAYGFAVTEVRQGAVDAARALKPEIPPGIHDEVELEKPL